MPLHSRKLRWLIRTLFVLALVLTLIFGARTAMSLLYWNNPNHIDRQIEGWMPVGYVGRSWNVPPAVMREIADIETPPGRGLSIEHIARSRGIPLDVFIAQLVVDIQAYRDGPHD